MLAVDGSRIGDLEQQLLSLSQDVTHLVISIGGNDVLGSIDILSARARSVAEALLKITEKVQPFERAYRRALEEVLRRRLPTIVCTIYNGNLGQGDLEGLGDLGAFDLKALEVGLTPFNDVILRVAFELGLSVIDLRLVCTDPADFANPIEPSSRGAEKIALAITRALGIAGDATPQTRIFY